MAGGGGGALPAVMARQVPAPAAIPAGAVAAAEVAADEVVRRVRPTEASERRRAEVIDYARTLVGAALGCEVFAFGSVPLKTYLPDGDIDLTVLGNTSDGSTLIDDLYFILGSEEQNTDAEFEVKELERIDAEVRLVKCTIENIIVDISFNQTGGICALSFLELVDLKVGKNHLFKRSVILIKAWCYYESRLLGAHHGLISTYALETLILYIFNLFHKSLHGPLEVLYRFLEYFSKFDWENYCISLYGPVALSSLPNLIVETTDIPGDDLLFDKEFLETSVERASVPLRDLDACSTRFRVKHLNIIDPLKECNNLGRSVNRANFNRIRTAFSYGARTLGQILVLSSEHIPDEIFRFFKNTLKRNEGGVRPDVSNDGYAGAFQCQPLLGPDKALLEDMSSMKISYKEDENGSPCCLSKSAHNNDSNMKIIVPTQGACFPADPKLAPSSGLGTKSSHIYHHAPKQYSYFYRECGNGGSEQHYVGHKMEGHVNDKSLMQPQVHSNNLSHVYSTRGTAFELRKHDHTNKTNQSVTLSHVEKQLPPFSILSLPDLSGDLDSQLRCLRQVQYHLEYLFDELLQSVQEASSDGKVEEDPSNTLTRSIFLNMEVTFPGPLSPSSTETDGRKSSPDTSSHSTDDFSQQSQDEDHWVAACQQNTCGTDVPSNGSSPSSYYAHSESSISWCHISDGIPSMHGTGPYITKKHLGEKWKTLINQPVKIKDNHASVTNGGFVPYKEQVALDSRAREITISQTLRTGDGYIRLGRKTVEKQSGHNHKEYVKPYNNARQIRRHYGDVCSKDLFQKQGYGADIEFAQPASIPRYQPMEVHDTSNECTYINNNSARRQIYGTRKGHAILDWPTNRRPICEPLKLESSRRGRGCFKRNLAAKQNNNDHNECISVVRDTGLISNGHAVTILNGSAKEFNPNKVMVENGSKPRPLLPNVLLSHDSGNNQQMLLPCNASQPSLHVTKGALETQPEGTIEFGSLGPFSLTCFSSKSNKARNTLSTSEASADASAFVLQRYRTGATQSRSPRFYRIGDEDHFPPLHAATR